MLIAVSAHLKKHLYTEVCSIVPYFRLPALFTYCSYSPVRRTGLSADVRSSISPVPRLMRMLSGQDAAYRAVPNLALHPRLWITPDLPVSQSARYALIIALQDLTNPAPAEWFRRVETRFPVVQAKRGVFVVVPQRSRLALSGS